MAASVKEQATKAHEMPSEAEVWFSLGSPRNESQGRCKTGKRPYTGAAHRRFLWGFPRAPASVREDEGLAARHGVSANSPIAASSSSSPAALQPAQNPKIWQLVTLAGTIAPCHWKTRSGQCRRGITPTGKPLRPHKAPSAATFSAPSIHDADFLAAAPLFGTKAARLPACEPNQGSPEQKTAYLTMLSSLAPPATKHSLPFPAPLPAGTFARWGRGTSGTGVSLASLQKSLFVSGVFTFPAFKTKWRQAETEHTSKVTKSAKGSRWPRSLQSLIQCPDLVSPGIFLSHPLPRSWWLPPHFFISTIIFFFPMGANARKCSRLLQHALSSPLSSRTKMGGVGKDGKVFMCPVLPHLISPPCWSTGAVGGMAGEASQLVSSAPSSADLVWPHRSQTP